MEHNCYLRRIAPGVGLVLLVLAAYWPAFRAGWVWDDDLWILNNSLLASFDGLKRIWCEPLYFPQYYPLTLSSFWIERSLWGLNPLGWHIDNVLLHAANAVLAWRVFVRLGLGREASWVGAALFAVHPVTVESVAWVTERKNTLSVCFFLCAALAWLRFEASGRWKHYLFAFLLFLAALCSKTVTCSFPAVMLLVGWWRREVKSGSDSKSLPETTLALLPFFITGAAFGLLTGWMERYRVGACGPEWDFSIADRILIAGRALWFYLGKLLWPAPVIFIYPRWTVHAGSVLEWLFPIGVLATLGALWFARGRWGRGPFAAGAAFCGILFPALGFVNTYPMRYSFVADHFQYLASLALFALGGWALCRVPSRTRRWCVPLIVLSLAILSAFQCGAYRSAETLWRDTLAKNPQALIAHNNLALICVMDGRVDQAVEFIANAVRIAPNDPEVHINAGFVLTKLGRFDAAILHYRAALKVRPDSLEARNNLGSALASTGRFSEAITELQNAIRLSPGKGNAQGNLGAALLATGNVLEALPHLQRAVQINPSDPDARRNLLAALRQTGRPEAAAAFERWCAAHQ